MGSDEPASQSVSLRGGRFDARRRGIGRALVEALEDALRERGCPKLNLQVRADNAAVQGFYEALGYRVEPRISLGKVLL